VGYKKTSWEPTENLAGCEDKVQEFCKKIGLTEVDAGHGRKRTK